MFSSHSSDEISLIRQTITSAETLLSVANFHLSNGVDATVSITDSHLWLIQARARKADRSLSVVNSAAYRLSDIFGVGVSELRFPKRTQLRVTWNSGNEHLMTTRDYQEGKQLADSLISSWGRAKKMEQGHTSGASVAEELKHLAELRDQGILLDSDWERAKDAFLGAWVSMGLSASAARRKHRKDTNSATTCVRTGGVNNAAWRRGSSSRRIIDTDPRS